MHYTINLYKYLLPEFLQVHLQARRWALAPTATAPPQWDTPNDEAVAVETQSTFKH
jgi:hypothetical protein